MAKSYVQYTGDGSTLQFNVSFPYLNKANVVVLFDGVEQSFSWVNATRVETSLPAGLGVTVRIARQTPTTPLTVYTAASTLKGTDLTRALTQCLYLAEETGENPGVSDVVIDRFEQYASDVLAAAQVVGTNIWARPVTSILGTPPGSPATGDRYLISPSDTTGVFVGHENEVAEWNGAWTFSGPAKDGQGLVLNARKTTLRWSSTSGAWRFDIKAPAGDAFNDNFGVIGANVGPSTTLVIGDSYSAGGGNSTASENWAYKFAHSLCNDANQGIGRDPGLGYPIFLNMQTWANNAALNTGSNGTQASHGAWSSRLNLADGQFAQQASLECASWDIIYDASNTTCDSFTFEIVENGVTRALRTFTKPGGGWGSGLQTTFAGANLKTSGNLTAMSDLLRVTAHGGNLEICAVVPLGVFGIKSGGVFVGATGGLSASSYNSTAVYDEMFYYMNFFASAKKTLYAALGTNDQYNAPTAKSPADSVASYEALFAAMRDVSRCGPLLNCVMRIPPVTPAVRQGVAADYDYEDYRSAYLNYANADNGQGITLDRADLTALVIPTYYDGDTVSHLHPDDHGHELLHQSACRTVGIRPNYFRKNAQTAYTSHLRVFRQDLVFGTTGGGTSGSWTAVANQNLITHIVNGRVSFSGQLTAVSGAAAFLTLGASAWPVGRDRRFTVSTDVGVLAGTISSTTGNCTLSSGTPTIIYMDTMTPFDIDPVI
jgi:hypothetical protein